MSGLITPKSYGAPAHATRNIVHVTETDDFVTPDQIAEQVSQYLGFKGTVPTAAGWTVMILMIALPDVTEGGVIVEDQYREQKSKASPQGIVIEVAPGAYNKGDLRFANTGPWCKKGDRVLFGRYSGKGFKLANGQELAFLVDTDIIAVVESDWLGRGGAHADA